MEFSEEIKEIIKSKGLKIEFIRDTLEISKYKLEGWMYKRLVPAKWERIGFIHALKNIGKE